MVLTLLSYDVIPLRTVTISGGNTSRAYIVYNGLTYTSGTLSVMDGDTLEAKIYSTRTGTIKLNGETVASGRGASYELTVSADATISISATTSPTITITM